MVILLRIVVVLIGKENPFFTIKNSPLFLLVRHQLKQQQQHLIVVQQMMEMLKNVFQMQKQSQVINFLIKILMYVDSLDKKLIRLSVFRMIVVI